jgi:hypothetical protein
MYTPFGPTLNADQFTPPFNEVVDEFVAKGHFVLDSLQAHLHTPWKTRLLDIVIVDNSELNACAAKDIDRDRIYIFRGVLERTYGTILGLLSTPTFLPAFGNVDMESLPKELPAGGFPPVPLLKRAGSSDEYAPLFLPNDPHRITVADVLIEVALEFLLYHEIGHVLGGHLEIPVVNANVPAIAENRRDVNKIDDRLLGHVLECDADAFSCHITSMIHMSTKVANSLQDVVNMPNMRPQDFALSTYLTAIGALFRSLFPDAPVKISDHDSSHPHPAVRACLIAISVMARQSQNGQFSVSNLHEILEGSIGNLEDVWSALCLPGQNPEAGPSWGESIGTASMNLIRSFCAQKPLLDQYARIPRKWDDLKWPDSESIAQ